MLEGNGQIDRDRRSGPSKVASACFFIFLFFAALVRLFPVRSADANLHTGCLQLYLEVLPEDKSQWISKTKELRTRYEKIKETVRAPPSGHIPPHHDRCDSKDDESPQ